MMSNRFEGIKLEFEGLFYGGSYEIEIFSDGRFYYSFIENESIEIQRGCFQILQKEVMMFEELMEHFELLKNRGIILLLNLDSGIVFFYYRETEEKKP